MEFKVSTLVIVMAIFVAAMATSASWISGIQSQYPDANLSADWNESFNVMGDINRTTHSVREEFGIGQKEGGIETGEGSDIGLITGTVQSLNNAKNTLTLIPAMIRDFMDNSNLPIPWWFYGTLVTIITISILFTIAGAFLRRIP